MSTQPRNDNHHSQPIDGLEPEISPDDPVERRLLADGTRWRAHTAPDVEPFAQRVNAALRETLSRLPAETSEEERPMSQRIVTPPPRVASQFPRHRPTVWGTLVAVAAAVAIVAMMAWVFQSISPSRLAGKTATATPGAAHITHPRGHWTDVVRYTVPGANDSVIVAPSNPRVAFRIARPQPNSATVTLARTSNGGASWTTLTLPTLDGGWFGGLAISPLDPQTVFLLLFAEQSDPHCLAAPIGPPPSTGGYSCGFQYVSRDGGAHWSHPASAWQGMHLDEAGPYASPVQVQGATLFTMLAGYLNGEPFDGWRLVASSDGGSTWRTADSAIWAAGQIVMSYTAIPGTSTLYARSVPRETPAGQQAANTLWRSDDAGAHWAEITGTFPPAYAALVGTPRGTDSTTLYALGAQAITTTGAGTLPVYASADGGRTWSQVPSVGEPQNQVAKVVGTLADGSLLVEFSNQPLLSAPEAPTISASISFYAWRPGDRAWFQVTPQPGSGSLTQSWLATPASGPQTLWVVLQSQQGTTFTVRQDVLE